MAVSVPAGQTPTVLPPVRRVLLALMLVAIGLPVPLTLLVHGSPAPVRQVLASPRLHDSAAPLRRPRLGSTTWWRGEFQRDFEPWFGSVIEPRGWIVQLTNQVYYTVFATSYMFDGGIIVGRDRYLYGLVYLEGYCWSAEHDPEGTSAPLVAKLTELHHALRRRDRLLLFVLTPSKAVTMPEFLPAGLCSRPPAPDRVRERFVASLRQAGITTIDGPELVQAMKAHDPLPPFPRGGTHWSRLAGARVSVRLMQTIARLSRHDMGALVIDPPRWDVPPTGSDADLARLLNLWRPPVDYPTASATRRCRATAAGRNTRLIAVGGSFLDQILDPIAECALFGRVDLYFYYDMWRFDWMVRHAYPVHRAAIKWRDELDQPTVLLVELNERLIGQEVPHLDRFLDDLRAALP
jgi:hypothetical protein